MRARPAIFALPTVFAVAAVPAFAQQPPAASEAAKAVIGKWEISNADRDRVCVVTLRPDAVGALLRLDLDKTCPVQMPELKDVVAWTIGGLDIVRLVDGRGKPVMEFTEVESGTYEAQRPGEGVFFMESAAVAAAEAGQSADQMAGDWGVVRGTGKTVCTITLTKTNAAKTADGQDNFALKLKPGCDPLVTRFGPASWYMDHGELVLRSRAGQFWRFEEGDPANWQRVPEGREPFSLVRQ